MWYTQDREALVCTLCPQGCRIEAEESGQCGVRCNQEGKLTAINYGKVSAASVDPVEKKPLYHFHPGRPVFSIGTFGCNMSCPYCQNWQISQRIVSSSLYTSEEIMKLCTHKGCSLIAYTYSEPVVWYEYVYECAQKARDREIQNILVTNGFINKKPLKKLLPFTDACNIDLKTFKDTTYRKIQNGKLRPVLDSIEIAAAETHVELTTLIVTDVNDTMEEMESIARFIASISPDIPWHISRYFPAYNYSAVATDETFIENVYTMAKQYLTYVYCGNMGGDESMHNTACPQCGNLLINRKGYHTEVSGITNGCCSSCGRPFDGHM